MRKFPGGLLLFPMLLAALFNTFAPSLFPSLGGISEAMFTTKGINYVVGVTCFCSGAGLNLQSLKHVLRKQGVELLVKTIICIAIGILYINLFGLEGVFGISAVAFITALCSTNPALFLSLEQDLGTEDDLLAFGLLGLFCVPAYPMFVFGIAQGGAIDWTPIISTLVPIIAGMIVGNLDPDMAKFLAPGVAVLTPFMGWCFGAGINLFQAVVAGPQGVLLTILFYIVLVPALYLVETKVLKDDGVSSISMSSIAGMSVSVPALIAQTNTSIAPFVESATAQISFGVVLTSIITPILAKKVFNIHADIKHHH